jgi:WD40 repeat protein/subtilisin-like proprotein convertase family protein
VLFGGGRELAQAIMDRVHAWTGGHPYLTQRVARGVARKGGRLEDVERVVREQLLAPDAADRDPVLSDARARLGEPSRAARRASTVLKRLNAGTGVAEPADAEVAECLWLSGTVRVDRERRLRVRNRIVKELVASGWLKTKGTAVRWVGVAAALLAVVAAGGYWYTQRLPVADIERLTSASADLDDAEAAYRRLSGLPGFTERADELWRAALARQSRAATTLAAAAAADVRLRELPGQEDTANRLLSEFWLRRARERAHAEQREAALLLAQRAASLPGAPAAAAAYLAELAGDDYTRLERSLRLGSVPAYWNMAFAQATVAWIDAGRQAARTPFGAAADTQTPAADPVELTALEHTALTRELNLDGEGTAGDFELSLAVRHAAAGELLVTLRAPSGAAAAVTVPRSGAAGVETFRFSAAQGSSLAQLADEGVRGPWRLTVVDRQEGNTGELGGWGLTFGGEVSSDELAVPVAIPDPTRTGAVNVQAVADRAIAWPVSPGVVGTLALWNLGTGRLEHDFTLPAAPREAVLDATGARVLASTERELMLWSAADGALVARIATETEFVLPPVFSADGGYVVIAERVDGANPLYSVLRSADAALVATIEGAPDAQGWELGPGGRYVVLQGPESVIRVIETGRGGEIRRLAHASAVERVLYARDGTSLLTVDRDGTITAWPLAATAIGLGRSLGRAAAPASVSASGDARRIAFTRFDGAVAVVDVVAGAEVYRLRLPRSVPVTSTQLSADGTELVTQSGALVKLWRLPPQPVVSRVQPAGAQPSALALDRSSDVAAVGLASGQLHVEPIGAGSDPRGSLAFFGHRGPIAAVALNGRRGLAATGGRDGVVRLWDLATGAPTGTVAQPADAAIALVALSSDGLRVASATARTVRVADVAGGSVTVEFQTEGAVTALAFAPDASLLAAGDAAGVVHLAALAASRERATARLDAAVTALAFAPDGTRLAASDAGGAIVRITPPTAAVEGTVRHWSQPTLWLEWSPDGRALLAATDSWVHSLAAPEFEPTYSELASWPASSTARVAISSSVVGFAGVTDGAVVSGTIDLADAGGDGGADAAALVAREWETAFALRLNDNGEPVPFDP